MIEADNKLIPEDVKDFAKELGMLCAKHGLNEFGGRIRPGYRSQWPGDLQFSWNSGRHEAEEGSIRLSSTVDITLECPIDYKEKLSYKEAHKDA